jgi:hypothetical protein
LLTIDGYLDSYYGRAVKEDIILAVVILMKIYSILEKTRLFSQALSLLEVESEMFNATNLVTTEGIFYSLDFE